MMSRATIAAAMLTGWMLLTTPVWAASFLFNTGTPDGKLGALSRRPSGGKIETETADDFILSETTVIDRATIVGLLIPSGTTLADIENVEVELYHVFPKDSDATRTPNVPTRTNSPGDVEIGAATRDASEGTLDFSASPLSSPFTVANSVIDGINKKPNNVTLGEGPQTGEEVQIDITFNEPIVLPADHYFFRPEALVTAGGDFLYLCVANC
jgi:hypothetical protein